jgi:hypothetical protein
VITFVGIKRSGLAHTGQWRLEGNATTGRGREARAPASTPFMDLLSMALSTDSRNITRSIGLCVIILSPNSLLQYKLTIPRNKFEGAVNPSQNFLLINHRGYLFNSRNDILETTES